MTMFWKKAAILTASLVLLVSAQVQAQTSPLDLLSKKMATADPETLAGRKALLKPVTGPAPFDLGGNPTDYLRRAKELRDHPERLKRIEGTCASACTLYLNAPNICIDATAVLWFHAPRWPDTDEISPYDRLLMISSYPPQVAEWVLKTGALDSIAFRHKLTGRQLIAMGLPACPDSLIKADVFPPPMTLPPEVLLARPN